MNLSALHGYKTYIVAAVTIAWAGFSYFYAHSMDAKAAEQMVETALLGITIRNGIANQGKL